MPKALNTNESSGYVRTLVRVNTIDMQTGPGPTFWLDWVTDTTSATEIAKERLSPNYQVAWIDILEQAIKTVRYRDMPEHQRPLSYSPSEFETIEIRERPVIVPLKGIIAIDSNAESSVAAVLEDGINDFTMAMLGKYYSEQSGKFRTGYPAQVSETVDLLAEHWSGAKGLDAATSSADIFAEPLERTA